MFLKDSLLSVQFMFSFMYTNSELDPNHRNRKRKLPRKNNWENEALSSDLDSLYQGFILRLDITVVEAILVI